MRKLTYSAAINEALCQAMEVDKKIFLIGQGLDSPWSFGDSTAGILEKFGRLRVYDPPISENGMTGITIGASMAGARGIVMHPRIDFMYLAMDQIVNHAAHWNYMFGGRVNVPVVIRGVINRGNEQAAQHSQSPHAMFAHVPGLKVVMPSTAKDAKGLMLSAIFDNNPVIYLDDRWLYQEEGRVDEQPYYTPIGVAAIPKEGCDITLVASSFQVQIALKAAYALKKENIDAEVLDLRTIKPLDKTAIKRSVAKTGHLIVIDGGWKSFGVSGEIITSLVETDIGLLKSPPVRICAPDSPVPASRTLEEAYFVNEQKIIFAVRKMFESKRKGKRTSSASEVAFA